MQSLLCSRCRSWLCSNYEYCKRSASEKNVPLHHEKTSRDSGTDEVLAGSFKVNTSIHIHVSAVTFPLLVLNSQMIAFFS
jgi:hypothetical protein